MPKLDREEAPVPKWPGFWKERRSHRLTIAIILALHSGLLTYSARVHSPGWDEPAHFAAGMAHVQSGVFDLYRVNPPLVRTWASLLPYAFGARNEFHGDSVHSRAGQRNEFWQGHLWLARENFAFLQHLMLARHMCIPFSLLTALCIYDLGNYVFCRRSALFAMLLWCMSPIVLGHASMITPDTGSAATATLLVCVAIRWKRSFSWLSAIATGIALGLAILTKSTNLVLIPLVCVYAIFVMLQSTARHRVRRGMTQLVAIGLVSLYVINMGYGFERPFKTLGSFTFVSRAFKGAVPDDQKEGNRFQNTILSSIPVPVPANLLMGIDAQRRDFEGGLKSFLAGQWSDQGWWYYYLYAFAVKEPDGTLILLMVGLLWHLRMRKSSVQKSLLFVCLPALAFTAFVSSQTGFNHHLRYLLPAYPFVYVLASATWFRPRSSDGKTDPIDRVLLLCTVWSVLSSLMVFPHSMAYFNEHSGGPLNGPSHLHNSNVDWGQDALYLHEWLVQNPDKRPVRVDFSGGFNPDLLEIWDDGVKFSALSVRDANRIVQGKNEPQWYAISLGHLYDFPGSTDRYTGFRDAEIQARIGYTIRVYRK